MIRTKQSQSINPRLRQSGIVYINAVNQFYNSKRNTVEFDIEQSILIPVTKQELAFVLDENGQKTVDESGKFVTVNVNRVYPTFRLFSTEKAIFKKETFFSQIGAITPEQFDENLIAQIAYVNSKEWTGTEIMQTFYWNLGINDMEIVTTQQLQELLTPYILE